MFEWSLGHLLQPASSPPYSQPGFLKQACVFFWELQVPSLHLQSGVREVLRIVILPTLKKASRVPLEVSAILRLRRTPRRKALKETNVPNEA